MSEQTTISTVVRQSAFAKQNMSMGDLFARRLQDIFNNDLGRISITEFGSKECRYTKALEENISFTLPNGIRVICQISTPQERL